MLTLNTAAVHVAGDIPGTFPAQSLNLCLLNGPKHQRVDCGNMIFLITHSYCSWLIWLYAQQLGPKHAHFFCLYRVGTPPTYWRPLVVCKWERVSYSLYYCVVALVQGRDLYNHIHVSQFTQHTPAHSYVASHRHEYDYKGHDPEQEVLHSSIGSRILSLTYYVLLIQCLDHLTVVRCMHAGGT